MVRLGRTARKVPACSGSSLDSGKQVLDLHSVEAVGTPGKSAGFGEAWPQN